MKQEIINQLNQLAKENEPFLFVINYEGTEAYIRKLSENRSRSVSLRF